MPPRISRRELLKSGAKAAVGLSLCSAAAADIAAQRARTGGARRPAVGDARLAPAFARLDEFIARHMRETGAPGMTLALADGKGALRAAAYGFADTKSGARVRPETVFEVGSISKSFAAVALLQLRDEGKLDLRRNVADYLPWLKLEQRHGAVTAHNLLSHTAGLQGAPLLPESVAAGLETFSAPGERFVYSNIGYFILGLLVEALDRRPFAEALRARVLAPLGMTSSAPVITNPIRARTAVGYSPLYDDRPFPLHGQLAEAPWIEVDTAAGGVASTSVDMTAYLHMLINRGAGPRGRLISDESFNLLTTPVIKAPFRGEDASYTYGLWVSKNKEGHTHLRHTGGMVAFSSSMDVDLTNGLAAFASVNARLGGYRPVAVTKYAIELVLAARAGRELPPMPDPPPAPEEIKNAADYAGTYNAPGGKRLVLAAEGDKLLLVNKGRAVALERSGGPDSFIVKHPDFDLFRLVFAREKNSVIEAGHGPDWYASATYAGPRTFDYPKEWDSYVGHYRHDSPWYGSTRVVLRKGALWLDGEEQLTPLEGGAFSPGPPEQSPERVSFGPVMGGRSLRMTFSTVEFERTYTP